MTHPMDSVPIPEPAIFIGTKLVPYEERTFRTAGLAQKLGYDNDLRHFYTADQLRSYSLSAYEMGRNAGLEEQAKAFDEEAFRTVEPNIKAMLMGFAAALRKDKR